MTLVRPDGLASKNLHHPYRLNLVDYYEAERSLVGEEGWAERSSRDDDQSAKPESFGTLCCFQ